MKRYGNIYEKICTIENLKLAHKMARKDKLFYAEVKMVDENPDFYLRRIQKMLVSGSYKVSEYTISAINDKGKTRELAKLPYYPDRIIQWAIMLQIEPVFKEVFCAHSCASIPERGISKASKILKKQLRDVENTRYCLQIDVKKFYPSIDRTILKQMLRKKFKDRRLLDLLDQIIDSAPGDSGVPIGSYLSQYLANFYLTYLDHWIKEVLKVKSVVRYMDDMTILCKRKEDLHLIRLAIQCFLHKHLNLTLKRNFQVYPVESRGISFVGFRFFHKFTLLRKGTCKRLKGRFLKFLEKHNAGQLLNRKEFCSAGSYNGWLRLCDGYRLWQKYIKPVIPAMVKYYKEVILKDLPEPKKTNKIIKFRNKVQKGKVAA